MIVFRKARNPQQTLNDLDEYLRTVGDKPVRWLAREVQSWGEFSYDEIAALIENGQLDALIDWQERWAGVVNQTLAPMWLKAIEEASRKATKGMTVLSDSNDYVKAWVSSHGGELITLLSDESRKAISNILLRGQGLRMAPRDIAKDIRPLIGLTDRQAQANIKYKDRVYQKYLDNGLSEAKARERSEAAALKYAGKQHRYRAESIVLTENAFAYNRGAHMGVSQSIADGYMGRCEMVWTTAGTNRVCGRCMELKDTVVGYTDQSGVTIPPLHPRCRCAIMYREVGTPRVMQPKPKEVSIKEQHATLTREVETARAQRQNLLEQIYQANQVKDFARAKELYAQESNLVKVIVEGENELKAVRIEGAKQRVIFTTGLERSAYEADDILTITKLLQSANEEFRLLWNLNEANIKVIDQAFFDGAHYSPRDRGILLNALEDRVGRNARPFKTVFHEAGHLIDHAMAKFTSFKSTWYSDFGDSLRDEGKAYLNVMLKRLKREAVELGRSASSVKMADAQKALSAELYQVEAVNRREVSDIWNGLTKGKVSGGFGHNKKYWNEDPHNVEIEAFAHMFCASTQNPEALNVIKKYFPKSYERFQRIVRDYLDEELKR